MHFGCQCPLGQELSLLDVIVKYVVWQDKEDSLQWSQIPLVVQFVWHHATMIDLDLRPHKKCHVVKAGKGHTTSFPLTLSDLVLGVANFALLQPLRGVQSGVALVLEVVEMLLGSCFGGQNFVPG